jgi:AraC-like DNA-binding protein
MERTREERVEVANEIIRQLGGRKFTVMTGASDYMAIDDGLTFRIPGTITKNRINRVRVILDPSDTYTVSFWNYRKQKNIHTPSMKKIAEHTGIYDDMLQKIFTAETGLDTHL